MDHDAHGGGQNEDHNVNLHQKQEIHLNVVQQHRAEHDAGVHCEHRHQIQNIPTGRGRAVAAVAGEVILQCQEQVENKPEEEHVEILNCWN